MVKFGSIESQWHSAGRPEEFDGNLWNERVGIIRERRDQQNESFSFQIGAELKKRFRGDFPCSRHIRRKKRKMVFNDVPLQEKPQVNSRVKELR